MKWRKLNRIIHRDLGYIFFGMTIIYSVSGIVLNHRSPGGDASIVTKKESFTFEPADKTEIDKEYVKDLTQNLGEKKYKNYYFPSSAEVMIYLENGHIRMNLDKGSGEITKIRKRPVLTEFNYLHYNKPKKLWTWFSDIFAVGLIIIAITGLFIIRGKKGIKRRGAILAGIGVIIPLIFLIFYLWTA